MATENIQIDVNSQELQALIAQLNEAQAQLAAMEQAADEAANSMDKLGDEAAQAGRQVDAAGKEGADGMEGMGLAAGAAGIAIAGVAAAAALASAAIAKYTEETAEQKTQLNALLNQTDVFLESLGRTIIESEGVSRAMNVVSRAMNFAEGNMEGLASVITSVVNFALDALNIAIQTVIVGWTTLKTVLLVLDTGLTTIGTALLNVAAFSTRLQLAVVELSLAFGQGLLTVLQSVIEKFGQLIQAAAPVARVIGLDMTGALEAVEFASEGLDTVIGGLQTARTAAQGAAAGIAEFQSNANSAAVERIVANNTAIAEGYVWMGDALIAVDAAFNGYNNALEENIRLTEEAATAAGKNIDKIRAAQLALEKYQRALDAANGVKEPIKDLTPIDPKAQAEIIRVKAAGELQVLLDRQAEQARARMEREEAARAEDLDAYKTDLETRFELMRGFSVAYEDLSAEQRARLGKMTDAQAEAVGMTREAVTQIGASSAAAVTAAIASGEDAGKALKAAVGQELVSIGTGAIFKGAIQLASGQPQGALVTAAGIAAVAAGTAMGGGGASPSVAPPRAVGNSSNVSIQSNFGFVGDSRAAARDVAEVNRNAQRRGM